MRSDAPVSRPNAWAARTRRSIPRLIRAATAGGIGLAAIGGLTAVGGLTGFAAPAHAKLRRTRRDGLAPRARCTP